MFWSASLTACLVALMAASAFVSSKLAHGRPKSDHDSTGILTNTLFAMAGLVLAFTFSGAYSRFDQRRSLLAEEINAIGTAYMRLDLIKESERPAMRELFRQYTLARAALYPSAAGSKGERDVLDEAATLQAGIWRRAVEVTQPPDQNSARLLLIPALNDMFDITSTRAVAIDNHTPGVVIAILFLLSATSTAALVWNACAEGGKAPWLHLAVFIAVTAAVVFVTLDLEYPRFGFARLDDVNARLVALAATMK